MNTTKKISRVIKEEKQRKKAIHRIVEDNLCTQCGTCAGICPSDAIDMHISKGLCLPNIEWEKCTNCGLCARVCPGDNVDFQTLNLEIFGKQPKCFLLGNSLGCYIGHSADDNLRGNSSSGGLVTQLLIFALEKGIVDGALVVGMRKDLPSVPEPFIAKTREEIRLASKSKYAPSSSNIILKEILSRQGKFAVVGLPCHIQGVRKAEAYNKELKEKIVLHLGLFCSHTVNFLGTEILLKKLKTDKQDIKQLDYRGNGWPGYLSVLTKKGQRLSIRYRDYWNSLFGPNFFTPLRCLSCHDHTNELADLSFGDAWLKNVMKKDKDGSSIVISRSKKGDEILKKAESAGAIHLNEIDVENVIRSQYTSLFSKKIGLGTRIAILNSFGIRTPSYPNLKKHANPLLYTTHLLQVLGAITSQRKSVQNLLEHAQFAYLRVWGALLYYLDFFSHKLQEDIEHEYARS